MTTNTTEITTTHFPFLESCDIHEILDGMISSHDMDNYVSASDRERASIGTVLLLCMTDTVFFHPTMMYDVLCCGISNSVMSKYLSRLYKRGLIKIADVDYDNDIRCVYYLSKSGYEQISSFIGNCMPYKSKTGQRLSETVKHDYGVSCGYLSFVRSPFFVSVTYEVSNMFEKSAMPSGKFMRRSLRPDAILSIRSTTTFGSVYLEHDTGSEQSIRMIDKLNLYQDHSILSHTLNGRADEDSLYEQNCIIFTFRKGYSNKLDCFSHSKLKKLLSAMSDNQLIEEVSNDEFKSLLEEFRRWTPAFKKHWNKSDLEQFMTRIKNKTEPSLARHLRYYQRNSSAARRNSALRILLEEFKKDRSSNFYASISEMMCGYPVCFCAYNCMDSLLPFLYMEDYPKVIAWLSYILRPYYGDISYYARHLQFPSNVAGGIELTMSNIFKTSTNEYLAVEYLSCDLSSCMRLNSLLNGKSYDLSDIPFKCVYVVDSYKDADTFLTMMNPLFKIGESYLRHNNAYDITFLSLTGDHLFTINKSGNEVKVNP